MPAGNAALVAVDIEKELLIKPHTKNTLLVF
jgi:hypothetical protein